MKKYLSEKEKTAKHWAVDLRCDEELAATNLCAVDAVTGEHITHIVRLPHFGPPEKALNVNTNLMAAGYDPYLYGSSYDDYGRIVIV